MVWPSTLVFQSTRPHGARHGIEAAQRVQVVVSIHAPARGATDSPASLSTEVLFQSTRPHGARRALQQRALGWFGFNPRARTGRDSRDKQREEQRRCFNPRARTGRDPPGMTASTPARAFQSTRPHGARRQALGQQLARVGFNPRARTGRDSGKRATRSRSCRFNPRARTGRDQGRRLP